MAQNETILLIDDDDNDRLLIQQAFQKAGLRSVLRTVADGREALEYLRGAGKYADRTRYPVPFLALLDLKMPGITGFEVLQWIRSQANLRRLLVVVLTSSSLQSDVDRAYELGANSYLVKPVEFEAMVNLVRRFETYWTEINRVPSSPAGPTPVNPQTTLD